MTDAALALCLAPDLPEAERPYRDPEDIVAPDFGAKPWPKACSACAFHKHDPQNLGAIIQAELHNEVATGEIEFYCVHRLSGRGLHRVCASAAAVCASALMARAGCRKE